MSHKPSPRRFVVRPAKGEFPDLEQRVAALGSVRPLKGSTEAAVVEIEVEIQSADHKETWESVRDALGAQHDVAPVLLDDEGGEHYPTGTIGVRFEKVPDEDELDRFAVEHGLKVRARNKYVAAQADFEIANRESSYLPEVVEKLMSSEKVRTAWAATESLYRRCD
ncbi:MAG: hypothetical protein GY719_16315 [bacterium]|nr:hypothetical protein [bacterium]